MNKKILDFENFVFNPEQVKQNYYSVNSSNANMLHPDLYQFVSCPKIRKLIAYYDTEKFVMRQIPEGGRKQRNDWSRVHNTLHVNKTFIGGFQ